MLSLLPGSLRPRALFGEQHDVTTTKPTTHHNPRHLFPGGGHEPKRTTNAADRPASA